MIKTILGLILLLIPFLLIYKFKDKKIGFAYILSFLIASHLLLAVVLQAFGIFNYLIVFGINLLLDMIIIVKTDFKNLFVNFKKIKANKIDWILIFVVIVLFIQLFSVHYNYTGKATSIFESYKEVKNMKYPYPYFSDEWAAVSFIKYSINSGKLPLVNPLWHNEPFPNLELPFHSFVSEIILLLNLNPLTQYTLLTIFSGLLICLLVYFILRVNKIDSLVSAIAALSIPYITNGANLPGLWTLVPLILGIISMLLGFIFMSTKKNKMVLFLGLLTLIFYPPLFVLYGTSLIVYFIFSNINKEKKIKYLGVFFWVCVFVVFILSLFAYFVWGSFKEFFSYILSKIFYETFTKGMIPDFLIFKIIPLPILFLSIFGILKITRKKLWLIAPIFVGLIYWILYSFVLWRFIIEYERVIVSTSILIVILSGLGLSYLIKDLQEFRFIRKYKILLIAQILILILFFVFCFFYTERDNWQTLKLHSTYLDYSPAAPASIYLHEDDLRLFKGIQQKRFLSLPWKGTVIGVATNNYPLYTKPATLTNQIVSFSDFMDADCEEKSKIAKEYEINYVYSKKFNCSGFREIGDSSEGLYLYEAN